MVLKYEPWMLVKDRLTKYLFKIIVIHSLATTIDLMMTKLMWIVVVLHVLLVAQRRQSALQIVIVMICPVSEENARISIGCGYSILLELLLLLLVVIAVVSVCVAAIRKKKNVDILNITHSLGSNDGNSSFANSSGLPCLLLC